MTSEVTYPLAFAAGVLSFLSPCVLPLIPAYLSLITGLSYDELLRKPKLSKTISGTLSFVAGFSVVFIVLGASSSLIGGLLLKYQHVLRIAGGIMVIIFGLFTMGVFRLNFLMREKRFHFEKGHAGLAGSFVIGMGFSAGWTPCIGPILGTILIYAGSEGSAVKGVALLSVYSLGLAIPFILSSVALNFMLASADRLKRIMPVINKVCGLLLIAFGLLLLTDSLTWFASLFPSLPTGL